MLAQFLNYPSQFRCSSEVPLSLMTVSTTVQDMPHSKLSAREIRMKDRPQYCRYSLAEHL